jgi:hypothetical protein
LAEDVFQGGIPEADAPVDRRRPGRVPADGMRSSVIRDELSKGRFDPAMSKVCCGILGEIFERRLKLDLGQEVGKDGVEDLC